jgi:hypothetical protein
MAITPLESPLTSTGMWLSVVELFPNWPFKFHPQHFTPPVMVSAQVWYASAVMALTPLESPLTFTGMGL